jgi:hypothetical protein
MRCVKFHRLNGLEQISNSLRYAVAPCLKFIGTKWADISLLDTQLGKRAAQLISGRHVADYFALVVFDGQPALLAREGPPLDKDIDGLLTESHCLFSLKRSKVRPT